MFPLQTNQNKSILSSNSAYPNWSKHKASSHFNNSVFCTKFARKAVFPVQKRKHKHHNRIQHIQINLGNKLHFKKSNFSGPNFPKKSIFGQKKVHNRIQHVQITKNNQISS